MTVDEAYRWRQRRWRIRRPIGKMIGWSTTSSMKKTQVSKANPTVRKILSAITHKAKGFEIYVLEVPASWSRTVYEGEWTRVLYLDLPELKGGRIAQPLGNPKTYEAPDKDEVFVSVHPSTHQIFVVVRKDAIDSGAISIATDALLEKDKQAAGEAVASMGQMAGIGLAIAEAQAKALTKKERGVVPKGRGKAAQLEREIEEALARRMAPSHLRKLWRRK